MPRSMTPISVRFGGVTRATQDTGPNLQLEKAKTVVDIQVKRLLGDQTGADGFTLDNILVEAGTAGGAVVLIPIEDESGTTYYMEGNATNA